MRRCSSVSLTAGLQLAAASFIGTYCMQGGCFPGGKQIKGNCTLAAHLS